MVKNADGGTHTRYERTYDGLPVLGGDRVGQRAKDGTTRRVIRATAAEIAVESTRATGVREARDGEEQGERGTAHGGLGRRWRSRTTGPR